MRNIWLVIKHDAGATFRQRSFWALTLLMPVFLLLINSWIFIENADQIGGGSESDDAGGTAGVGQTAAIGLVDESALTARIPEGIPEGMFVTMPDEEAAQAALEAGEIKQYVHIPADYVDSGKVTIYDEDYHILQSGEDMGVGFGSKNEWMLEYLIDYNIVDDHGLWVILGNPVPGSMANEHALNPPAETEVEDQAMAEAVAAAMPYLYYFLLIMGSQYLMRSVIAEKENRTVEVLLLSLESKQLMIGKILAMSLVTLVQVVVWVGGGILILGKGADLLKVAQYTFPPGFGLWASLFLVLGFLLFASIMAAVGTIAPTAREAGQAIWLLVLPLMPTLMFGRLFLEEPNSTIVVALSLFPLSAPAAMVTRLAVAPVPLWQALVSLGGLALLTYLVVVLAGRFFRPGNLLSAESFSWKRLATGWRQ